MNKIAGMLFWSPWSLDDSELWVSNSTIVMYNMCIIYNKIIHVCSHHQKVFFENESDKICHYFCHPRFYSAGCIIFLLFSIFSFIHFCLFKKFIWSLTSTMVIIAKAYDADFRFQMTWRINQLVIYYSM